jgi:cytochrome P450
MLPTVGTNDVGNILNGSSRSSKGGIQVRATERGLPIALKLADDELSRDPMQLAHDILSLCQVSAKGAQVARRRDLVARGFSPAVIRGLALSTEDELARAVAELYGDDTETAPSTWMRPV